MDAPVFWIMPNPTDERIEATAKSLLFGFVDEVVVKMKFPDGGSIVDVRSRSRRPY